MTEFAKLYSEMMGILVDWQLLLAQRELLCICIMYIIENPVS